MQKRVPRPRHHARQRGTAYVLVLSITTMLVVLGLAATQLARNGMKRNTLQQDQVKARIAAEYAQDYLHKLLDGDTAWRDGSASNVWYSFVTLDGTTIYYGYEDEIDGDIQGDYTQPFRLHTMAVHGDTRRLYSVEYIPGDANSLTRNPSSWRQETLAD